MKFIKNIILGSLVFICPITQSIRAQELSDRLADYFNTRDEAAFFQIFEQPDLFDPNTGAVTFDIYKAGNGDENSFGDLFVSSFTKGLEHDPVTGLVTAQGASSFKKLVEALVSGKQDDFNAIKRAGVRKFVAPQTALMFSLEGRPIQLFPGFQAPKIQSAEAAAELIEVYLQAIMRHVNFDEYGTGSGSDADGSGGSKSLRACAILKKLGKAFKGPRDPQTNTVTPKVLFRGISQGVLVGPYQSQFCLHDVSPLFSYNTVPHKQLVPAVSQTEFGISWDDFIALQNGNVPRPYGADKSVLNGRFFGPTRHTINSADLATMFHEDGPCEAFYYAAQILLNHGCPSNPSLPYNNSLMPNEGAFVSSGPVEMFSVMAEASHEAIKTVWAHKWLAHRSLRPEAFAALVHRAKTTGVNEFGLHASLFDQDLLDWVIAHNQRQADASIVTDMRDRLTMQQASTYLLSQEYPEASPLHPAFLSGHAGIAGACATVLKAYFNGNAKIASFMNPVKPNGDGSSLVNLTDAEGAQELTVNSELHKLASNACLGSRNAAGIHYRCDADMGCLLGEQVAIQWLMDQVRKHREEKFIGFEITKFDGTKIRITKDSVIKLS